MTAPLRRLADRFANEIVLAACAGRRPPSWVLDAVVTSVGKGLTDVQLREPAVLASAAEGGLEPGSEVRLHLDSVDLAGPAVAFSVNGARR